MKIDWYLAFAWLLILIISIIIGSYYIVNNINKCTSQPLQYAVDQVKNKFDIDLAYGKLNIFKFPDSYDYIEFGDINSTKS